MPPDLTNSSNSGQPTPWKEIEKVEKRLGGSIGGLDQRVSALEMAGQLQSFQNTLTKERLEELAKGQNEMMVSLENSREKDLKVYEESTTKILERLDEVQFKNKAETLDKIKWMATGVVVSAVMGGIIAAIVNTPM